MQDDSMNQDALNDALLDDALLNSDQAAQLDMRIVHALESAPEVRIPADFAARVAAQVPMRPLVSVRSTHYGYRAMAVGIVVLFALLIGAAGHSAEHSALGLTLQWTLCGQFIGLVVWLSASRHRVN